MPTMPESASFPAGMRRMGWVLAALMLLYPIDYYLAKRATYQMIAADRAAQRSAPASSGMQFDLRTATIHCGPVGWAGSWAFLIGAVWTLVASSLWIHYRLTSQRLTASSRRAFLVTAAGVAIVLAFMMIESYG
jgi:hypothetical protein